MADLPSQRLDGLQISPLVPLASLPEEVEAGVWEDLRRRLAERLQSVQKGALATSGEVGKVAGGEAESGGVETHGVG